MKVRSMNDTDMDWLRPKDHGKAVKVKGHWSGDFIGTVKWAGRELAIVTDHEGNDREIVYIKPVEFELL